MADVTITEREVYSHGSLRGEIGKFTSDGSAAEIRTKLNRIVWFEVSGLETVELTDLESYWNSATASSVEDDPGVVHFETASPGDYIYHAIGSG